MDAILTAGGIPQPDEPLYELTRGDSKAMLDIAGKPMIQWVLDALSASHAVENVVLIGPDESSGLTCNKPLFFIPNQGGMIDNISAGVRKLQEIKPHVNHILAVSSDIPSITGEMVDWLVDEVIKSDDHLYYCVVPREVMESRYPGSKRSYLRLKDLEACGGDMNAFKAELVSGDLEIWRRLAGTRKNVFKQAALIGFDTLFLVLLRRLTVEAAVQRVTRRLGIRGRAVISPYAELAMDVDKPHQLEIIRKDLEARKSL
jgi:GTP:adenosylcobinamide-phosphate guanylyltransferase